MSCKANKSLSGNSSNAKAPVASDIPRPRIIVPEDLHYTGRKYISSPTRMDPWTPLGCSQSQHGDIFARIDSLGLSKTVDHKL